MKQSKAYFFLILCVCIINHLHAMKREQILALQSIKRSRPHSLDQEIPAPKRQKINAMKQEQIVVLQSMEKSRPPQKKFECLDCHRWFSRGSSLANHRKIHTKEDKRYICFLCTKEYVSQQWLDNHVRSIHLGERFSCHICCDKKLMSKKGLEIHLDTHNYYEKKFSCQICHTEITTRDSLARHMKRWHS